MANTLPTGKCVDLTIQFIGATGLPKMDVVGTADPYFVAKLDGNLSFMFVPVCLFSPNEPV